jgi:hypothetical protein
MRDPPRLNSPCELTWPKKVEKVRRLEKPANHRHFLNSGVAKEVKEEEDLKRQPGESSRAYWARLGRLVSRWVQRSA